MVGLGFNKVSNDYRVVRIVYFQDKMDLPKVEVYSLRERTWKEIKDPVVPRRSLRDCEGVYVNGRIYWMEVERSFSVESSPYVSKDLRMLSFDFDTEVFGEVKVPEEVSNCLGVGAGFKLMEFDGSLALCVSNIQVRNGLFIIPYRIWLMRLDNGVISWILRFTNELKEPGLVMNITKTGTILVQRLPSLPVHAITRIFSCNLNTMHYKDLGLGGRWGEEDFPTMPHCIVDTSFIESLVMYEGGKSLLKFSK